VNVLKNRATNTPEGSKNKKPRPQKTAWAIKSFSVLFKGSVWDPAGELPSPSEAKGFDRSSLNDPFSWCIVIVASFAAELGGSGEKAYMIFWVVWEPASTVNLNSDEEAVEMVLPRVATLAGEGSTVGIV